MCCLAGEGSQRRVACVCACVSKDFLRLETRAGSCRRSWLNLATTTLLPSCHWPITVHAGRGMEAVA